MPTVTGILQPGELTILSVSIASTMTPSRKWSKSTDQVCSWKLSTPRL